MNDVTSTNSTDSDQGEITFKVGHDEFKEFICGILGKPQIITKSFYGTFDLSKEDIENIHHLLAQRIMQQNNGMLASFNANIFYDDQSSVVLNSINEFSSYNEIRPICSKAVHLSFTFLVHFNDKTTPEKQQIDISIIASSDYFAPIFDDSINLKSRYIFGISNTINFRVEHTARTWGADIESLLTGQIKSWLKETSKTRKFVNKHDGKISFLVGAIFFLSCILGISFNANHFMEKQLSSIHSVVANSNNTLESVGIKVDTLINMFAVGAWQRFTLSAVGLSVLSLIVSIFLAAMAANYAGKRTPSFVTLTKKSEELRNNSIRKSSRDWIMFYVSIATSIACGVIANIIFQYVF
ncbi:MAG: hypothetical protein OQK53_06365 [Rhodospirillales bacterium]|nr:hypothetical protein [Rhodospirillales bacterium]